MPGRQFIAHTYRFGYQNQQKDDEIIGAGNSIEFKYRMEDTRLGRFFSVDPLTKKYAGNSPFAFSENRPIDSKELEGLEKVTAVIESGSFSYKSLGRTQIKVEGSIAIQYDMQQNTIDVVSMAANSNVINHVSIDLDKSGVDAITRYMPVTLDQAKDAGIQPIDLNNQGQDSYWVPTAVASAYVYGSDISAAAKDLYMAVEPNLENVSLTPNVGKTYTTDKKTGEQVPRNFTNKVQGTVEKVDYENKQFSIKADKATIQFIDEDDPQSRSSNSGGSMPPITKPSTDNSKVAPPDATSTAPSTPQ